MVHFYIMGSGRPDLHGFLGHGVVAARLESGGGRWDLKVSNVSGIQHEGHRSLMMNMGRHS